MIPLATVSARDIAGARVVQVAGEVDLSNAADLLTLIGAEIAHDAHLVLLDLSRAAYLDSTAVAMIFRLAERLRTRRQELRLVVPLESPVRAVLELTNVPRVIPLSETVQAASPS